MVHVFVSHPILLIGMFLVTGYTGSLILKRFNVPHIIVYLVSGFTIANTIMSDIDVYSEFEIYFRITETLALGLIGFKIGTELKFKLLKNEPKFIIMILVLETGLAFILVFAAIMFLTRNFLTALIFAGLATATAPAATVEVIRKLNAAGPLTTRIQWILAFDDVVAIAIVEAVLVFVETKLGSESAFTGFIFSFIKEIGIAVTLGVLFGFALDWIIERMNDDLEMMEFSLGVLILVMGISLYLGTSVITACMVIGVVSTNHGGDNFEKVGDLLEVLMSPILMLFFVLVGARITFSDFNPFPIIALTYLVFRTIGKLSGAFIGAHKVDADPIIKENLGLGLLAQGGVSIGLASIANDILTSFGEFELGKLIITNLIISTLFSVSIGTLGTTIAIKRSKEHGKKKVQVRKKHMYDTEVSVEE